MKTTLTIEVTYEQGLHDWMKYPEAVFIDGKLSDLNTARTLILGFQPQNVDSAAKVTPVSAVTPVPEHTPLS